MRTDDWKVMFRGEELSPSDYKLKIRGSKFELKLLNQHIEPGTKASCVVDTEQKIIIVRFSRTPLSVMASSVKVEVDEIKRVCFDLNDLEEV